MEVDWKFLQEYFQLLFSNPADFTFSFSGPFGDDHTSLSKTISVIALFIGSIPVPKKKSPLHAKFSTISVEQLATKLKQNTTDAKDFKKQQHVIKSGCGESAVLALVWPVDSVEVPETLIQIANQIVETKLQQILRFKLGKVYTVDVRYQAIFGRLLPGFNCVFLLCQPQHVEQVVDIIINTLKELQHKGPTHKEVESAFLQLETKQQEKFQDNSHWSDTLNAGSDDLANSFGVLMSNQEQVCDYLDKEGFRVIQHMFPIDNYQMFVGLPEEFNEKTLFTHNPSELLSHEESNWKWIAAGASVVALSTVAAVLCRHFYKK
mmetsp:Transcript_27734/g.39085  ORF Transcript_27734/g.39085 Transcript_27734/m.39085 type:complete len:320 (+) Transcript_27734:1517-2476(+)